MYATPVMLGPVGPDPLEHPVDMYSSLGVVFMPVDIRGHHLDTIRTVLIQSL
jgi:hypothetical protein